MVTIHIDDDGKTSQISDWSIYWSEKYESLQLTGYSPSKEKFTHPLSNCRVFPVRELGQMLLSKSRSTISKPIERATIYGERYAVVFYPGAKRPYVYKLDSVGLAAPTQIKQAPIFRYFLEVAEARQKHAESQSERDIAANVVRQLEKLPPSADTALHAYCTGRNKTLAPGPGLIYPFGVNESQLAAVEQAFSAQISLIEGPPGTGKTQTILNILANILLRGQTAAVLSNNNAAVDNVHKKLEKSKLGHTFAKLGNQDNRRNFFANLPASPTSPPEPAPSLEEIQAMMSHLKRYLHDQNRSAQLQAEIDELTFERRYLQQWQQNNGIPSNTRLARYGLSPRKIADLMAYLAHLGEQRIRLKDRIELLFNFRIFRTRPFSSGDDRLSVFHTLQMHYYDKALQEKQADLLACCQSLERGNFTNLLNTLKTASMRYLKQSLQSRERTLRVFDDKTYRSHFDEFMQRFPILGSGTHSIVNSIAPGAILDYVIIDEASQQDIVPGILALGCAKNMIVVGDRQQLAHIPVILSLQAPADAYDCERYSLLDSCVSVFKEALPRTLLKEHYRCHPRIIQFCNQQFYGNALVPMTEDKGEAALRLVVTAKGNHARENTNQRELDSLLELLDYDSATTQVDGEGRGFIAPFRAQANLAGKHLPTDFENDTVHKFQGRECDEIVFSTVLDKKRYNQDRRRMDFVDDPRMVNVAVSRAKHRLTLVTGDDVFTGNNGHIAALIRYFEYYAQDEQIVRAPVVSAFDLLYKEYDQSLARLNARLRPEDSRYKSEQIAAQLLRQALREPSCHSLMYHDQVKLSQVASATNPDLTAREREFMARASCDFVIYFRIGKNPIGVIEIDGGSHEKPDQAARDALKNSILAKNGIPILRLRTVESDIEQRLTVFISQWTSPVPST